MGMFRRIGKDIKRSIESQERSEEFTLALETDSRLECRC
jgi:hypothetical protein